MEIQVKNEEGLFTSREEEVLQLLAGHLTNQEMCEKLSIKQGTLVNHFKNIQRKTHIYGSRKILLIKYAVEHGYGKHEARA
jgi:DNA-binding CsgD family transcriptional regulator